MDREKLQTVVLTMSRHAEFITDTHDTGNELYFRYKAHAFSILRRSSDNEMGEYSLCVYPNWNDDLGKLARIFERQPEPDNDIPYVVYHQRDYRNVPFLELWNSVRDKHNNMDFIFDDILSDVR